jgi:hypothetical protein
MEAAVFKRLMVRSSGYALIVHRFGRATTFDS